MREDSLLAAGGPNLIKNAQIEPSNDEGVITGTMSDLGDIETIAGESHYVIIKKKAEEDAAEEESEEGAEASSTDAEEEDDGKDATGGDQTGDAKEHLEEVGQKQEAKSQVQKEGKAGEIKKHHD